MADDDYADVAPGTTSVLDRAGSDPGTVPGAPTPQQDIAPSVGSDQGSGYPFTVDSSRLWDQDIHNRLMQHDAEGDPVAYQRAFTPGQMQQLADLNGKRALIGQALSSGQITQRDAAVAMQNVNLQARAIQPMTIPRVRPPSMKQVYQDQVHHDRAGNTYLRQQDGSIDIRPPSQNSPQTKQLDAMHDAAMAQADQFHADRTQAREHLHDAIVSPPDVTNDPAHGIALNEQELQRGRAKVEAEVAKNNAAAQKEQQRFAADQSKKLQTQQDQQAKEQDRVYQRRIAAYNRIEKGMMEPTRDADGNAVLPPKPDPGDVWNKVQEEEGHYHQRFGDPHAQQTPTLAPPQAPPPAAPTRLAAVPGQPTQPPSQATQPHPLLAPNAPPEAHQARFRLDEMAKQYGDNPAAWPPPVLQEAQRIKAMVKPYRQQAVQAPVPTLAGPSQER